MPAAAQDTPEWRYWFAADGLRESYSRVLGTHPGGGVAVRHGATHTLDLLDGYDVSGMPEARVELDVDWENVAPVYHLSAHAAWTVEGRVLKQFADGRWTTRATRGPGERMLAAIPRDPRRIVVLFSRPGCGVRCRARGVDRPELPDEADPTRRPALHARPGRGRRGCGAG